MSRFLKVRQPLGLERKNIYAFECFGPRPGCKCPPCRTGSPWQCLDPELKWKDGFENLIPTVGLNDILTNYYKGSAYTAAFFVFLKGTGAVVAGDTMASHAGWSENTGYTQSTRPVLTLGTVAAGSVDNVGNLATFSINAAADIYGAGIVTNSTKGGSTGILGGAGFFAGGSITAITKANPGVVTVAAHGLAAGEKVLITGVVGMTQVNGIVFTVGSPTTNTFALLDALGNNVDSTSYTTYSSGGLVEKQRHADNGDTVTAQITLTAASA